MHTSPTIVLGSAMLLVAALLTSCGGGGAGASTSGNSGTGNDGSGSPPPTASLKVVASNVPDQALGVALDAALMLTFNANLSDAGLGADRVLLSDGNTQIAIKVTPSGQALWVQPITKLHTRKNYRLTIKAGATAADGSVLQNDYVANFKTVFGVYESKKLTPADPSVFNGDLPRIVVADVNGDSRPDLIELAALYRPDLFAPNGYTLNIYLQSASGQFVKSQKLEFLADQSAASKYFNNLIPIAIDGDNRPELLVPEFRPDDPATAGIRVFKAGADGKFAATQFIKTNYTENLVALDVDGDGKMDLVGSNQQAIDQATGGFQILLRKATGFAMLSPVTLPAGRYEFGVADLDHDGKRELIVNRIFAKPNNSGITNELLVYSQRTAGVFSPDPTQTDRTLGFCTEADYCRNMKIIDWNGTGKSELVFTAGTIGTGPWQNQVFGYSVMADGSLSRDFRAPIGSQATVFAIEDLDRDSVPDLLLVGDDPVQQSNFFSVVGGNANRGIEFSDVIYIQLFDTMYPPNVAVADIDGDGQPDIIFDSYNSGIVMARRVE